MKGGPSPACRPPTGPRPPRRHQGPAAAWPRRAQPRRGTGRGRARLRGVGTCPHLEPRARRPPSPVRTPTVKQPEAATGRGAARPPLARRGHRARHRRGAEQRPGLRHHVALVRGRGRSSAVGLSKDGGSAGQRPRQQHVPDAGRVAGSARPRSAWRALGRPCLARRPGVGLGQPATMARPDASWSPWLACIVLLHPACFSRLGVATASRLGPCSVA